jgi:opacity protein-like surface antigen
MKKTLLVLLFALCASWTLSAQESAQGKDPARFRPKFFNLNYSSQTVTFGNAGTESPASDLGFGFATGRSYILHKKPIARMLRIGIDATWFDLNYGNWNQKTLDKKLWMHKVDIGMGVGLGVHVNPISRLGVHAYFRYNPTFSAVIQNMMLGEVEFDGGYASYFTTGGAISWGVISLGVEARFGGGTYHTLKAPEIEVDGLGDDDDIDLKGALDNQKHKLKGCRAYISFRF